MRPIDADESKKHPDMPLGVIPLIDSQPTIDDKDVVHAHWQTCTTADYTYECSNCGYGYTDNPLSYCYDCGAKMDEEAVK